MIIGPNYVSIAPAFLRERMSAKVAHASFTKVILQFGLNPQSAFGLQFNGAISGECTGQSRGLSDEGTCIIARWRKSAIVSETRRRIDGQSNFRPIALGTPQLAPPSRRASSDRSYPGGLPRLDRTSSQPPAELTTLILVPLSIFEITREDDDGSS